MKEKYRPSVFLLLLGEIFVLAAAFSNLTINGASLGWLSIFGLVGAIISLVGVIMLKNSCSHFKKLFYATLAMIVMVIATVVLGFVAGSEAINKNEVLVKVFAIVLLVVAVLVALLTVYSGFQKIYGCREITNSPATYGRITALTYALSILVPILIQIVSTLLATMNVAIPVPVANVLSIVVVVLNIAGQVFLILLLAKTVAKLK